MTIIVTQMHRADHGELEARVSLGNGSVPVTREYGSWMVRNGDKLRDIKLFAVKKRLADDARTFTKREAAHGQ
jgi:hypothetical protein